MTGIMQMFTSVGKAGPTPISAFTSPAQLGASATHARINAVTCKTSTGLFVSVGYNSSNYPVYATSTDGSTWTTPALMNGSTAVAYMTGITCRQSDGRFVAVGYNSSSQSVYATSTNGSTWTTPALMNGSSTVAQMWAVAVRESDGRFVAVGHTGTVLDPDYYLDNSNQGAMVATSTDGSTWTTPYAVDGYRYVAVTVNQTTGRFIAVNSNTYTDSGVGMSDSLDGITWTFRSVPNGVIQFDTKCWAVAVNNAGVTVAVGSKQNYYNGINQSVSLTSPDGYNWPNVTVRMGTGFGRLSAITVTPSGLFVAVGDFYTMQTSNFQQTILHASQPRFYGDAIYATSTDGYTWTAPVRMGGGVLSRIKGVAVNSSGIVVAVGWSSSDTTQLGAPLYATTNVPPPPTTIGQAYGGGFYAGKISTTGDGVATHYLIVAPKASGENSSREWGVYGAATGTTSVINGPTNTASLAALGASYQAAVFCSNLNNSGLNGYTDWYLPAKNELEVLYYFLRPTNSAFNSTEYGSNANAVSPEPISTNYTYTSPAQTSVVGFRTGETDAFTLLGPYWSSTERDGSSTSAWLQNFVTGTQYWDYKVSSYNVRAVRRIAV